MARTERIEFPGHSGQLAARLDLPPGKPRGMALFAHCFSCSKDVHAARRIAAGLAREGFGVLRFDFTGLGYSEGDFANTNFSTNVQDLVAAARWLAENHGGPDLLVGHSLGGAAVIVAAADIPQVHAVATIGAPSEADHVLHQFAPALGEIETAGKAEVMLAGRPFTIEKQFVEDVRGAKVRDAAGALRKPLIVMHAPRDEIVGIDNATGLFVSAKHPKSFISLDDADHLLTRTEDAAFVARTLAAWAGQYVPNAVPNDAPPAPAGKGEVLVAETGTGKFTQWVVSHDGHVALADEPASYGGDNLGLTPYDFVEAGLGACTSMTLRMYAQRKKWPLKRVAVTVRYERVHAKDCDHCEEGVPLDVYHRQIRLEGDLSAEQQARLMEIADKCPVHQTLERSGEVRTLQVK
jgi:uncharacterized OsmC-like protein/alpha/beta superfamily hydrolase